jgi:hypothetical protein
MRANKLFALSLFSCLCLWFGLGIVVNNSGCGGVQDTKSPTEADESKSDSAQYLRHSSLYCSPCGLPKDRKQDMGEGMEDVADVDICGDMDLPWYCVCATNSVAVTSLDCKSKLRFVGLKNDHYDKSGQCVPLELSSKKLLEKDVVKKGEVCIYNEWDMDK